MKKLSVIFIAAALVICLCACQSSTPYIPGMQTNVKTDASLSVTTSNFFIPQAAEERSSLSSARISLLSANTDSEIAAFQALLEKSQNNWYANALTSEYASPEEMDLYQFFYGGFPDESKSPTAEETEFLNSVWSKYWIESDLCRCPSEKMDAVLQQYFGITLKQSDQVGLDHMVYWETTDCYYKTIGGSNLVEINVYDVVHNADGYVQVYYHRNDPETDMVVTLNPTGDHYQIMSNLPVDTGESGGQQDGDGTPPKTGDPIGFVSALLALSATGCVILLKKKKVF